MKQPLAHGLGARAFLLSLLSASVSLFLVLTSRIPWNSDQAIVGLMARDVVQGGAFPVFFSGQEYLGAIEAYLLAAVFTVFPQTVQTQLLLHGMVVVACVLVAWRTGAALFGEKAGFFGGLYLALGPPFFFWKSQQDGAYGLVILSGTLIVFGLAKSEEASRSGRPAATWLCFVGLVGGLAWWLDPLCAVYGLAGLAAVFAGTSIRRSHPGVLALSTLLFLAGSAPWWLRNLRTHGASLKGPELGTGGLEHLPQGLRGLAAEGLPILFGLRRVWPATSGNVLTTGAALLVLLLLVFVGFAVALRGRDARARFGGRVLLPVLLATPLLVVANSLTDFREPRYLMPMYAAAAPLAGIALSTLWRWWAPGLLVTGALFLVDLLGYVRPCDRDVRSADPKFQSEPLMTSLLSERVEALYASYWDAYRVTFASTGRVVATPFGLSRVTRRPRDRDQVDRHPSPGFLLEPEEAQRFEVFLKSAGSPFRRIDLPGRRLIIDVGEPALSQARRCLCVPTFSGPASLIWGPVEGPHEVVPGSTAVYRLTFTNGTPVPWSSSTHLGYHWVRPSDGYARFENPRAMLPRVPATGETLTVDVSVPVNVAPGSYRLVFDIVEEGVTWLADLGILPPAVDVEVRRR